MSERCSPISLSDEAPHGGLWTQFVGCHLTLRSHQTHSVTRTTAMLRGRAGDTASARRGCTADTAPPDQKLQAGHVAQNVAALL